MADLDEESYDAAQPDSGQSEYITERQRIAERFIALGGGSTIQMDLAKMPKLADLVTDQHRDMVSTLAMCGLSNEAIARLMGISKERLQTLFDHELGTGFESAKATLIRSLYLKGVAGSDTATIAWLRNHNRSDWVSRLATEKTDKGMEQSTAETDALKDSAQLLLSGILSSMSTDKALYKRPVDKVKPVKSVVAAKPKPVKAGTTVKRARGD